MAGTAFLFPGQGAQHIGMGRTIVESSPRARELFDRAGEILGYDLAKICFEGPQEQLDRTNFSQPALFVTSLAALEWLRGERPEEVASCTHAAGLSLGEYTALVFADAMSFDDGLKVVAARGEAMQAAAEANPSSMVSALLLDREKVEQVRDEAVAAGPLWIANYLCPGNTVLSGSKPACEAVVGIIEQAGGKPVPLAVAGAFHTPLMESACERLAAVLETVEVRPPRIPVVSNVDAVAHSDAGEIREILVRQVVRPVLWEDSMRALLNAGVDRFFEIGPGKVLKGLLKRIDRKASCETVNDSP
jgi:[acyl-carrier-protein] S-malonyltransferase